jgi:hypothetical protein
MSGRMGLPAKPLACMAVCMSAPTQGIKMLRPATMLLTMVALVAAPFHATGQEVTVAKLPFRLRHPSAVAIRPGGSPQSFEVYFSDHNHVSKFASAGSSEPVEVITKLPAHADQTIAPGLLFLDRSRLVVSLLANSSAANILLFEFKADQPLTFDLAAQNISLGEREATNSTTSINVYSLARTFANDRVPDQLIAATYGSNTQLALWKLPVRAGTLDKPVVFGTAQQNAMPAAVAVSKQGYVLVAQSNENAETNGSRLTFFNPIDAAVVMQLNVDLENIRGLVYSPKTGNLYAANFGTSGENNGASKTGVYRLDDASEPGKPACRAVKIADVLRPTAMAFAPDGSLYVAAAGNIGARPIDNGYLVKLNGDL